MTKDEYIYQIENVSPGTDDRLDVGFDQLGLTKEVASSMVPVILSVKNSSGTNRAPDESVALDLTNERLTISEGATDFTDGDIYTVALKMPVGVLAGTSRASS